MEREERGKGGRRGSGLKGDTLRQREREGWGGEMEKRMSGVGDAADPSV